MKINNFYWNNLYNLEILINKYFIDNYKHLFIYN